MSSIKGAGKTGYPQKHLILVIPFLSLLLTPTSSSVVISTSLYSFSWCLYFI